MKEWSLGYPRGYRGSVGEASRLSPTPSTKITPITHHSVMVVLESEERISVCVVFVLIVFACMRVRVYLLCVIVSYVCACACLCCVLCLCICVFRFRVEYVLCVHECVSAYVRVYVWVCVVRRCLYVRKESERVSERKSEWERERERTKERKEREWFAFVHLGVSVLCMWYTKMYVIGF